MGDQLVKGYSPLTKSFRITLAANKCHFVPRDQIFQHKKSRFMSSSSIRIILESFCLLIT